MKRCLSLIVLALALVLPATASATTYGAAVGSDFANQLYHGWSASRVTNSLSALYKAGGRVGRADSNWEGAEPKAPVNGRHTYDWNYDDLLITEMSQARLRWEPTLQMAPKWARAHRADVVHGSGGRFVVPLPPGSGKVYGTYAAAFLKRYGAHGAFWKANPNVHYLPVTTIEVWNEPDNKYNWGPQVNLKNFVSIYEAVRSYAHRADHGIRVMTGGLAWTRSSLPRLLQDLRRKPVDAVAFHPYAKTPGGTVTLARYAISEMRAYGRGHTPLIANEFGWSSAAHTFNRTRARNVNPYVRASLIGLSKLRLTEILPFEWTDRSFGLNNGTFARALKTIRHH
jgi:hypothetical protein